MHSEVNNPAHYNGGTPEAIDFIEQNKYSFSIGNVFKYILRCNRITAKGEVIKDLNKALWYLTYAYKHSYLISIDGHRRYNVLDLKEGGWLLDDDLWEVLLLIETYHEDGDLQRLLIAKNTLQAYLNERV